MKRRYEEDVWIHTRQLFSWSSCVEEKSNPRIQTGQLSPQNRWLTFAGGDGPRETIKSEGMQGVNPLTDHHVKLVIRMQLVRIYSILC